MCLFSSPKPPDPVKVPPPPPPPNINKQLAPKSADGQGDATAAKGMAVFRRDLTIPTGSMGIGSGLNIPM